MNVKFHVGMSVITSIFLRIRYGFVWKVGGIVVYRPIPSSKNSYFQNEAKGKIVRMKMSFICMRIKKIVFISIALHLASLWKRWFGRFVRKYQLRKWRRDRHFYVVFQATRSSSRLQSKGSTVSSSTVVSRPWVLVRFREPNSRRPALQASGLPTELILLWSCWLFNRNFFVISKTKAYISWCV